MSVRRSVVWGFAGQFIVAVATFVGSAIVARLLSPGEVGVYAAGMGVMALVTVVTAFGANAYVIRHEALDDDELAAAFTVNAALNILLALMLALLSTVIGRVLGDPGVAHVLRSLALVPLVQILEFRPATMLAREMRFQPIAIVNIIAALTSTGTTIGAAFSGFSYMSLSYGVLAGAGVNAIGANLVGHRHVGFRMTLAGTRPIIVFGLRMMSIGGVAAIAQRMSELVLGRLLGLTALGLYARASNLANLLFSNIYGTASRIAFAKLSQDKRDNGSIRESFVKALEMILAVMWPIAIGLALLSRPFIYWVYGSEWIAAAPVLSILMIALAIALAFGMNWEMFVLADETARQTRYELIRAVFGTAFFVGGTAFGIVGAALGRVGEALVGLILYLPHMTRLADIERRAMVAIYARAGLLTVLATTPSLVLMTINGWAPAIPLGWVALAVAMGICAWAIGLVANGHPLAYELTGLVHRLRHKRVPV